VSNTTKVSENKEIIIKKSEEDIKKIKYFLEKKGLSPTVLNTYICCPLHFYYEKIKGVYEKTEPSAIINSAQFGTIFHSIMENLYIPFKGKVVNESDLRAISDNQIKELAQKVFTAVVYDLDDLSEVSKYNFTITGENLIIYEIIVKLVKNTLLCDIERTPFTHYEDEITIDDKIYTTAKGNKVKIKGTIDRIDIKEDKVYLIDYKTTSLKSDLNATKVNEIETLENFFDNDANYLTNSKKYVKEILQMCFYNLLYAEKAGGKKIETYLYLAKKSFDIDNFLENTRVDLPENWETTFREHLDKVIDDLLDIEKPITQSKEPKNLNCKFCPFIPICGKIVKEYH
jgi:ATP-dependent exoDNAse (exonuclease V) beta subunit